MFNWRTPDNENIDHLEDFAKEVLRIPDAHRLVSQFTILVDDKKKQRFLMVLRPYQIHTIQKIISQAAKHEGGFIWHATGSGKTITSFVATKLLSQRSVGVDRTVMVVDRRDLDNQTKGEFGKFASEFHTGQTTGDVTDNTLIVGVGNRRELSKALLSKKNNDSIIVTTIQKLSAAISDAKGNPEKFEKLQKEHIVFIVDECHRAVSDEQMKEIKKTFQNSTWFGLTGTPIFFENRKQENGTNARTTADQYNYPRGSDGKPLCKDALHSYTTKNAMEDKSVLNFQVEYNCLLDEDDFEDFLSKIAKDKISDLSPIEREAFQENALFEQDDYIEKMLEKIFKRRSVLEHFKFVNGHPTMSAVLTTHSIAQAKLIYHKLQEMKKAGVLLYDKGSGKETIRDADFPRVAITYSLSENQSDMNDDMAEMQSIMEDYKELFGTPYTDVDKFNKNINNRLARKDAQYQKDGQWLDLVIVVDRLLTGFDSPTIQTLYVDRELKWHKLLQAFSRTNRVHAGKESGIVVTFRKPATMRKNVENAIKLFTQQQDWETLVPKEYHAVKNDFKKAYENFLTAKDELTKDRDNTKKKIEQVRAYQRLEKIQRAIKSYGDYEKDIDELKEIEESIIEERSYCEDLKYEIKEDLKDEDPDDLENLLSQIEFTSSQRALYQDKIDSYYISQLIGDYQKTTDKTDKDALREKITKEIDSKPSAVKHIYNAVLDDIDNDNTTKEWASYFEVEINRIIQNAADTLKVPFESLKSSFNEYRASTGVVPFINPINEAAKEGLGKELFEATFNEKFRNSLRTIEAYWKDIIDKQLIPLKQEMQE